MIFSYWNIILIALTSKKHFIASFTYIKTKNIANLPYINLRQTILVLTRVTLIFMISFTNL